MYLSAAGHIGLLTHCKITLSTQLLHSKGYRHITLQIGQGQYEPRQGIGAEGVNVEFYRYKASLKEDMCGASLIISHGGTVSS